MLGTLMRNAAVLLALHHPCRSSFAGPLRGGCWQGAEATCSAGQGRGGGTVHVSGDEQSHNIPK